MKRLLCLTLLLLTGLCAVVAQNSAKRGCNIIYIGNSITAGMLHADRTKSAPPVFTSNFVGRELSTDINFRNCGRSGATTLDFVPQKNRDFKRVEKAIGEIKAMSNEPIIFSIMLGTNDSANFGPYGSPISNEDYKSNLMTMIERIRELAPGAIFILHRPIWYSPNTHNASQYLVAGQKRMEGYTEILIELAENNQDIHLGDCDAFDFFSRKHLKYMFAEDGKAGIFYLHPNEAGARKLARYWARAISDIIKSAHR